MFGPGPTAAAAGAPVVKKGLLDNYDDVEGYYNFQVRPAASLHHDFTLVKQANSCFSAISSAAIVVATSEYSMHQCQVAIAAPCARWSANAVLL